jgi:beta-fructofuranosidase
MKDDILKPRGIFGIFIFCCLLGLSTTIAKGQEKSEPLNVNYNPNIQPTNQIQYFKPVEADLFVGDCIPFYHNGIFYLYWLVDKGHHSALKGLGGHQWALSTSKDLINWKHFPIALGIDEDWEKSICTGSLIYANNSFYAYYATRIVKDGKTQEQLSYAISSDGTKFIKQKPNPFFTAPEGYVPSQFRDPKIISSPDGYHLFISSYKSNPEIQQFGGCLAHLYSKDLKNWEAREPILTGQNGTPECSDYFYWNGWYYLIYSTSGNGYYVKSRNPFGPWEYPRYQALKEPFANVPKTAEFNNGRRMSAAWIPTRDENKLEGRGKFGGNIVIRELVQDEDGTLGTKFAPELIPACSSPLELPLKLNNSFIVGIMGIIEVNGANGIGSVHYEKVPYNCRITLEIEPLGNIEDYGLYLRSGDKAEDGFKLNFSPDLRTVQLGNKGIEAVENLGNSILVDIVMKGDIIDVCINNHRCIVNRCPELKGDQIWLYAKQGMVHFTSIKIYDLNVKKEGPIK